MANYGTAPVDSSLFPSLAPDTSARNTIVATVANVVPLTAQVAPGTAGISSVQEWKSTSGSVVAKVNTGGAVQANYFHDLNASRPYIDPQLTGTTLGVVGRSAAQIPLTVRGVASQTGNLQEWQDSAGVVSTAFRWDGFIKAPGFRHTGDIGPYITATPSQIIVTNANNVANTALTVKGMAGQTGDLQQWQDSTGSVKSKIDANGYITSFTGTQAIAASAASVPSVVKAAASQTANLQEWQDNTGTVLTRVAAAGGIVTSSVLAVGQSAGPPAGYRSIFNSGVASTVPILLQGVASQTGDYLQVQDSAGSVRARVDLNGGIASANRITAGTATVQSWAFLNVNVNTPTIVGAAIRGASAQTADLQQWQDSTGANLLSVDNNGTLFRPAGMLFSANTASTIGLRVKGAASQTANLQEWQDSAGSLRGSINNAGDFYVAGQTTTGTRVSIGGSAINSAQLSVQWASDRPGVIVKGAAPQTADLQQWQDSTGVVKASIGATGYLTVAPTSVGVQDSQIATFQQNVDGRALIRAQNLNTNVGASATFGGFEAVASDNQTGGGAILSAYFTQHSLKSDGSNGDTQISAPSKLNVLTGGLTRATFASDPILTLTPQSISARGLVVKGFTGQTANLQEWQDSSGITIGQFEIGGVLRASSLASMTAGKSNLFMNADTGGTVINTNGAANKGLIVRATAAQTADLQQWQTGTNVPQLAVDANQNLISYASDGTTVRFRVSPADNATQRLLAQSQTATTIPIVAKGAPGSQTASLQEWQDSTGVALAKVGSLGQFNGAQITAGTSTAGSIFVQNAQAGWQDVLAVQRAGSNVYKLQANATNGPQFSVLAPASIGLAVQGAASQTADLQQWQDSAGAVIGSVDPVGQIDIGNGGFNLLRSKDGTTNRASLSSGTTAIEVQNNLGTTAIPLAVKGFAGQTGNLQEWRDSASSVKASVEFGGRILGWSRIFAGTDTVAGAPLTARGTAGQTGNLQEWQDSASTVLATITSTGGLTAPRLGINSVIAANTMARIVAQGAAYAPLVLMGAASQTGNLQEWQDSTSAVISRIDSAGGLHVPTLQVGTATTAGNILTSDASGNATWAAPAANMTSAVILAPNTTTRNVIQPIAANISPLIAKGFASQTANLQEWQNSAGTVLASFSPSGQLAVSGKVTGVAAPTAASDAATKAYVDAATPGRGFDTMMSG